MTSNEIDFDDVPAMEVELANYRMNIASRVAQLMRERANIYPTQRDFAKAIHMKESQLSKILHGDGNLTLGTIAKVALGLGENVIVVPGSKRFKAEVNKELAKIESGKSFGFMPDTNTDEIRTLVGFELTTRIALMFQQNKIQRSFRVD